MNVIHTKAWTLRSYREGDENEILAFLHGTRQPTAADLELLDPFRDGQARRRLQALLCETVAS